MNIAQLLQELIQDKKKLSLAALILALVFYVDFTYVINAQISSAKRASLRSEKLKSDIAVISRELALMQKYNLSQAKEISRPKASKAIVEGDLPAVLKNISDWANKNSVKLMQINPDYELKEKTPAATGKEAAKSASLLINMDLLANYHNFGKFLNALENSGYLWALDSLKIEADKLNYLQKKIALSLRAYVQK